MTAPTPEPSALETCIEFLAYKDNDLVRSARAELAALREGHKNLAEEVARNCETMRELRKDEARLDWLQRASEKDYTYACLERGGGTHASVRPWHVNVGSGPPESRTESMDDELRAAIDVARKEKP
jgi:hypothetical protein